MAGTAPILTGGFGSWGGVELIPTLGFGIGEGVTTITITSGTAIMVVSDTGRTIEVITGTDSMLVPNPIPAVDIATATTIIETA